MLTIGMLGHLVLTTVVIGAGVAMAYYAIVWARG